MSTNREPIKAHIKREVRQRCGFGCILCGKPLYEYDHILGYAITERHVADELTLLCDQHHAEKTKELLPQDAVLKANADPHNVRVGVSTPYGVHYSGDTCVLRLPTCLYEGQKPELVPLLVRDQEIIAFRFVDDNVFLNCTIVRPDGEIGLLIEENELIYKTDSWDVEFVGRTLTIRNGSRDLLVKVEFRPPSEVFIERLNLVYSDMRLWVDDRGLHVRGPRLGNIERERDLAGVRAAGRVCISLDSKPVPGVGVDL